MEGFVAIEDRPLVTKEIGPNGGKMTTEFDSRIEATVSPGTVKRPVNVKMMVGSLLLDFCSKLFCLLNIFNFSVFLEIHNKDCC